MSQASFFKVKKSEAEVTEQVDDLLDAKCIFHWRNTRGRYRASGGWISYGGKEGSSDKMALWPGGAGYARGTFWCIELKKEKNGRLKDSQIKWLLDVRSMGGIASVVDEVEDIYKILENPLYLPERYQKAVDLWLTKRVF